MPTLSIVIPAFNEGGRLPRTLDALEQWLAIEGIDAECLVVDDGSSDETCSVVARHGGCRLLSHSPNRGKGFAVRSGVLASTGDRVLTMDADLATPLEEFAKLSEKLDAGYAIAIGSRPLRESELLVRQPLLREWAGRAFNAVVRLLAVPGIRDTQCGFKLFERAAAHAVFSECRLDGFGYDVESLFVARKLGLAIAEVPVRWRHQEGAAAFATAGGYLRHGVRMLRDVMSIRRNHRGLRSLPADRGMAERS
ncbi:MAG: dolichyl-phosphate beta-glucosyltransferase [Armatimonadota bacterium]